jgi:dTDP-4-amino-4,6-dideoxygalactose transaminase
VLLPAFVGWSPREGSGVFDPVRTLGVRHAFYAVDERLDLDLADLARLLAVGDVAVVVLIHYFGRPDPQTTAAAALARAHGATVLEDEAHALYTDLVAGAAGRVGDACVLSLHKMLPVDGGGALVLNAGADARLAAFTATGDHSALRVVWEHDLAAIAAQRRENAAALAVALAPLAGVVEPLWSTLPAGTVLQTFPVRIHGISRDDLYHAMNAAGYGVVSLYHTLVAELSAEAFPASHRLARTIMNLPVHQDATPAQLQALVAELARQVARAPRSAAA